MSECESARVSVCVDMMEWKKLPYIISAVLINAVSTFCAVLADVSINTNPCS